MPDFGYRINKDTSIDFDHADLSLARRLQTTEPTFGVCMACGSCAGTCTAAQFTGFSFRKLLVMIKRGQNDFVLREVSKCMLCGKCTLVCPRGVNTRRILSLISDLAKN